MNLVTTKEPDSVISKYASTVTNQMYIVTLNNQMKKHQALEASDYKG